VSKRSRRRPPQRPPTTRTAPSAALAPPRTTEPERLLLDQIAAGELDPHLVAIADAVHARHELLHTINSQKALAMLCVGDRVRINHHASPQYLHGVHGIITNSTPTPHSCACTDRSAASKAARSAAHPSCSTDSTPPREEQTMTPTRQADPDLDHLIDEITVECHDEYEQLNGFENAFDEDANFPCPATVLGETIELLSVAADDDRRDPIATCQCNGKRYEIALLDTTIDRDPATTRPLAAYRRWNGT
jgi:hypothetical protein